MGDGFHEFRVTDSVYGSFDLLVAIPQEHDPWGKLAPIRGTPLGPLIREVSGESMAHARHGFLAPLVRTIGPAPRHLLKLVPKAWGMCGLAAPGLCAVSGPRCRPDPKLPDCYEPPVEAGVQGVVFRVVMAWRDGKYVLVVNGPEFALL